jgi:hypothetical protein
MTGSAPRNLPAVNALGLAATRQPQMPTIMNAVMLAHVVELVAGEFLFVFEFFNNGTIFEG